MVIGRSGGDWVRGVSICLRFMVFDSPGKRVLLFLQFSQLGTLVGCHGDEVGEVEREHQWLGIRLTMLLNHKLKVVLVHSIQENLQEKQILVQY